jgi:hypothetical protein
MLDTCIVVAAVVAVAAVWVGEGESALPGWVVVPCRRAC